MGTVIQFAIYNLQFLILLSIYTLSYQQHIHYHIYTLFII